MSNIHEEGGFASNCEKPLESIFVEPSYTINFFNKTLGEELEPTTIVTDSANSTYDVELEFDGDITNVKYARILHYTLNDPIYRKEIEPSTCAFFINNEEKSTSNTVYKLLPLCEVINPRFVKTGKNTYMMYFYSNFTTMNLPDNQYTIESKYLRRTIEFASNKIDNVYGHDSSLSDPLPNNLNYSNDSLSEDNKPRIAFLSAILKIITGKLNGEYRKIILFEKPKILTWIGHRFGLDYSPPILINKTQKIDWAKNKEDSDSLDDDAVNDDPIRQVPYHHVVSGLEAVMYPSYAGLNFKTKPIHEIYDKTLDHLFQTESGYSKTIDFSGDLGKLTSIGVYQEDITTVSFPSYDCSMLQNSSSASSTISESSFFPAKKHFAIFKINMDGPSSSSSSSSSYSVPSYLVEIPEELNPKSPDKPDFWSYYWDSKDISSSSFGGGEVVVDYNASIRSWYGEGYINGVLLWVQIEDKKPYGYINTERRRLWLTIGLKSNFNVELDCLWQGYRFSEDNDGLSGDFKRFWCIGDDCPDIIVVS